MCERTYFFDYWRFIFHAGGKNNNLKLCLKFQNTQKYAITGTGKKDAIPAFSMSSGSAPIFSWSMMMRRINRFCSGNKSRIVKLHTILKNSDLMTLMGLLMSRYKYFKYIQFRSKITFMMYYLHSNSIHLKCIYHHQNI